MNIKRLKKRACDGNNLSKEEGIKMNRGKLLSWVITFTLVLGSFAFTPMTFNAGMLPGPFSVYAADSAVTAPVFDDMVQYNIDAGGQGIAKGDFNGDGITDLILTHENTNTFSCSLGMPDGTFDTAKKTESINYASSPCPGDFNEDENLDLAVVSGQTNSLHVHLGNGDGTFITPAAFGVGSSPCMVITADVNNDDHLDLIVSNYHSDNISVLTGNGDGTFDDQVNINTGNAPAYLVAMDFNKDEMVDLAVVNYDDTSFMILINNSADGEVSYSNGGIYSIDGYQLWETSIQMGPIIASDIIGNDGIPDLALTVSRNDTYESYILFYQGSENGTFQLTGETIPVGKQAYSLALGDYNSDNQTDIAMTNRMNSKVSILCKDGDSWELFSDYPAGNTPTQIVMGDFNKDGADDLAAANPSYNKGLTVLLQQKGDGLYCIIDGCETLQSDGGFSESTEINGETYYCVGNAKQLAHIQEHFEGGFCTLNFYQTKGFDLADEFGEESWTPIGWGRGIFIGTYLGNGYEIENMILREKSNGITGGLFSEIGDIARIEGVNLTVGEVSVYRYEAEIDTMGDGYSQDIYIGGIAGRNEALLTIEDCSVTFLDDIIAYNESGDIYIGGITARNDGSVLNCITDTTAGERTSVDIHVYTNSGSAYIGGIAGYDTGDIKHSDHKGGVFVTTEPPSGSSLAASEVSAAGDIYLGGIAGYVDATYLRDNVEIEDCQNNGYIECYNPSMMQETRACAGGIAGYLYQGYESAPVIDTTASEGDPYILIKNCANTGETGISAIAASAMSGGIVGATRFTPGAIPVVQNCYNEGNVYSEMTQAYKPKAMANTGNMCIGAASGGIAGAVGGVKILTSYSSAPEVSSVYEISQDTIVFSVTDGIYDIAPDTSCYAGGITGLIWDTGFTQNYYLSSESVEKGVGGAVVQTPQPGKFSLASIPSPLPYQIVSINDPKGVTAASETDLKTKTFFGNQWRWYSGGGVPVDYWGKSEKYDSENPWRYTAADTYPVLRGKVPTKPDEDNHNGRDSHAVVTTSPPALNKTDHFAYVVGYPDGTVKPMGTITREEVAVIFYRLMTAESRKEYYTTEQPFADVSRDRWSNDEIATLYNAKIITGNADGSFKPAEPISRAEFAAIAAKFDKLEKTQENRFSDISTHWAKDYINSSAVKGWIGGYEDGTFRPDDNILRCEAMKLINEVLDRRVDVAGLAKDARQWLDNTPDKWYFEIILEATNTHDYERADTPKSIETWTKIKADPVW